MKSFYFKRKSVCLTALWGLLCLIGTIGLTSCDDKNEEDAEDEMIKEGGKNQEPELAMEEFIEETETEIENDYEER